MKLKGAYSGGTSYDLDDVVLYTDGVSYVKLHPCPAGVPPVDTRYWGRTSQIINDIVSMCMDAVEMAESGGLTLEDDLTQSTAGKKALDAHQGKVLNDNKLEKSSVYNGLDKAVEGFALDARQGKALKDLIPTNVGDDAILLNSSTASSTKQFIITVDDSGELSVDEVTEETQEGGGT